MFELTDMIRNYFNLINSAKFSITISNLKFKF